mgnify:CR=1 FL=1
MQNNTFRLIELIILFVGIPVSFTLEFPIWVKMIVGLVGFSYVIFVLLRIEKNQFRISDTINWKLFWNQTLLKLIVIAIITTLYVWFFDYSNLYKVVRSKPMLWGIILFVYSIFSVYPQELIYRTFFFQRYEALFNNAYQCHLVFISASVF